MAERLTCPGVICNGCCESCGFSPWEQKRRLKTGHFEILPKVHILHNDLGEVVHVARAGCKTLVFKKGVSNDV